MEEQMGVAHAETAGSGANGNPRPGEFSLDIASGMLESLGLNMYTSIGKSLSEFVANAYDADATEVVINIPFAKIEEARSILRENAKQQVKEGTRDSFTVLVDPLPDDIQITIRDNGHGMSPSDIRDKLLIVSRNRRKGNPKTESGLRNAMGRKGLGKLAGFGTAQCVTIRSKREGETFATSFTMDYAKIAEGHRVHESKFPAVYQDGLDLGIHGTVVTLSSLRCDSLKASEETIRDVLAQNFAVLGDDFKIVLNDNLVAEAASDFEFTYPPEAERDEAGLGTYHVVVNDMLSFDIKYVVRFRARDTDGVATDGSGNSNMQRGSLPAARRGARIYCNRRLAAGPSLLKLHTGMHNFHSQAYMECIVHADAIDQQSVDHIGTNRADLKGDSEVVEALRDAVTELMRRALYEHSKFRDELAAQLVSQDDFTQGLLRGTWGLSRAVKEAANKLLRNLASVNGVKSDFYRNAAPLVLESMNTGDVLAKLVQLEHEPVSLPVLAHEMLELARIENRDVMKLYRGRRLAISTLKKLIDRARESWKKGKRFENDLHQLLKDNPWLIQPEFSRYLTSDKPLGTVAEQLSKVLKVDQEAPTQNIDAGGNIQDEDTRPDLVFAMVDAANANTVVIVELKTPNYPLRNEHLSQLERYMMDTRNWLKSKSQNAVSVRGFLIGDTDEASTIADVRLLNDKLQSIGPLSPYQILPLPVLLDRANQVHLEGIEAAEKNEDFFSDELSTNPVPMVLNDAATKGGG